MRSPLDSGLHTVTHALVLCAGLGTRLRPLTEERPKPLVPVLGRPLASYALEILAAHGVRHVVANAHHLADQIHPGLSPWAASQGMTFTTLVEETILGTGGGIRNALPHLGARDFVVFNGDVLAAPDLSRALAHHRATGALMTLVLREDPSAHRLGAIEVTAEGEVVRILNEGPPASAPTTPCLFTGVYIVSHAIAPELPADGCVVRHTLRRLLAKEARVSGVIDTNAWYDLGTVASYARAQFDLLRGRAVFPGFEPPREPRYVAADARLAASVTLGEDVIVSSGAKVRGAGALTRAIVWDDAETTAPCEGMVVSRGYRVAIPGDVTPPGA